MRGSNPNSRANLNKAYNGTGKFSTETARKAQKKSAEARVKNKTLKEELRLLLSDTTTDKNGIEYENIEAICIALIKRAMQGNVRAYEVIRDTIGEKPVDRVEVVDIDPEIVEEVEAMVRDFGR